MDIYRSQLLDHYRSPRNCLVLEKPDFVSRVNNPSCGDVVTMYCRIDFKDPLKIAQISFQGSGCVISQASASLLIEHAAGMKLEDVLTITHGHILDLVGMSLGPTRLKCALLALEALQQVVVEWQAKDSSSIERDECNVESCRINGSTDRRL